MKKTRAANGLSKPIETNFVTADLLPEAFGLDVGARKFTAEDVPRVAKALEWNEKEWSRCEREAVERFERLFPLHGIDRTGDDARDFQRLAFQLVEKLARGAGIGKNPEKIELFFHLYDVTITGNATFDFMRLIGRLADEVHPGFGTASEPESRRLKRDNPRTLLLLLADVETAKQNLSSEKCKDVDAIRCLINNEPFKSQWGAMKKENLANWLCEARDPERNDLYHLWQAHESLGTLPQLIKAIHRAERGENHH